MFTGLIETMGTIAGLSSSGRSTEFCIRPDRDDFPVDIGGSVAIDGVCLTLEKRSGQDMFFTAVLETLNRTTLAKPFVGRRVNLERAMRADGRFDGHLVLGHVDGFGEIISDRKEGVSLVRTISIPPELAPFMAEKGSVAIDGISLTIAGVLHDSIFISLIPHTIGKTTMSTKKPGDFVNLESDVLARYLYRLMNSKGVSAASGGESLLNKMERLGF